MSAGYARPGGGANLPSSGDITALSEQIGVVHAALERNRLWTRLIALAGAGLLVWCIVQQVTLNGKTADIARLEHQTAQLAHQNAASNAKDARDAHALCLRLNKTRSEILPAWQKVLSSRPDWNVLLPGVEAAEPLGRCPGSAAAGR